MVNFKETFWCDSSPLCFFWSNLFLKIRVEILKKYRLFFFGRNDDPASKSPFEIYWPLKMSLVSNHVWYARLRRLIIFHLFLNLQEMKEKSRVPYPSNHKPFLWKDSKIIFLISLLRTTNEIPGLQVIILSLSKKI